MKSTIETPSHETERPFTGCKQPFYNFDITEKYYALRKAHFIISFQVIFLPYNKIPVR